MVGLGASVSDGSRVVKLCVHEIGSHVGRCAIILIERHDRNVTKDGLREYDTEGLTAGTLVRLDQR